MDNPPRRRRDLLKQYYQQEQTEEPEEGKSQAVRRADPLDINSSDYHPELAHNKLSKECTLQELLVMHNNLVQGKEDGLTVCRWDIPVV